MWDIWAGSHTFFFLDGFWGFIRVNFITHACILINTYMHVHGNVWGV